MATTGAHLHSYGAVPKIQSSGDPDGSAKDSWVRANQNDAGANDDSPRHQDVPFAILFLFQLIVMLIYGVHKGSSDMGDTDSENGGTNSGTNAFDDDLIVKDVETHVARVVFGLLLPCTVMAFFLAHVGTAVIIPMFPEIAVKTCLAMSLVSTTVFAILVILSNPAWYTWISMFFIVGITAYYVRRVWCMTPFAAANLTMGIRSVAENWGLYLISIFMMMVSFAFFVFWFYAANGIFFQNISLDVDADDVDGGGISWGIFFLLLVSLYWTGTVLLNIVRVTTSGAVGTWCFVPEEASGCCSSAVISSFVRSMTYSFGSICFGSLLEALVTALRVLAENARDQSREDNDGCASILYCVLECILSLLEDIIEYFNQWAYVLIGIYGYGYLESGRRVMELFRARGWTAIITNDLVGYVLSFTSVVVGILTGLCAVIIEMLASSGKGTGLSFFVGDVGSDVTARWIAFFIGIFVGIFISSIMMNVLKGAVNTVIVCYADGPQKLEENHPQLTYNMAKSWVSVFPECGVRIPVVSAVAVGGGAGEAAGLHVQRGAISTVDL